MGMKREAEIELLGRRVSICINRSACPEDLEEQVVDPLKRAIEKEED